MNNAMSVSVKRTICLILIAVMISAFPVFYSDKGYAEDTSTIAPLEGSNLDTHVSDSWTNLINSYITSYGKGYMTVNFNSSDDYITASYYDSDFKCTSRKTINLRYPFFAGFHESDDYYFVVTGRIRDNEYYYGYDEKNDSLISVAKYDKNWGYIAECIIRDVSLYCPFITESATARTITQPFHGTLSMDMYDNDLIIRTSANIDTKHPNEPGGYNNIERVDSIELVVDTDSMELKKDSFYNQDLYSYGNPGYDLLSNGFLIYPVSQFVKVYDHSIVVASHGRKYPRSFCLAIYNNDSSDNYSFIGNVETASFMDFKDPYEVYGSTASIGGFEVAKDTFLLAGSAIDQNDDSNILYNNVFVASMSKTDLKTNINWITDYGTHSVPHLVKIDDKKFMIIWGSAQYRELKYALLDQYGKLITDIYTMEGYLSDCHPELINGKIVWYTYNGELETFYQIDINDLDSPKIYKFGETYKDGQGNDNDNESSEYPDSIQINFANVDEYYHMDDIDWHNEATFCYSGINDSEIKDKLIVEAEDPDNCIINMLDRTITFKQPGRYVINAYPKNDPNHKIEFLIIATKPLSDASIESKSGNTVEVDTKVDLVSFPDGGNGTINYDFIITGPDYNYTLEGEAPYYLGNGTDWYPQKTGEYKIKVKAYGKGDYNKPVESPEITITVVENKDSADKDPAIEEKNEGTISNYTHTVTYYLHSTNTVIGKISNRTYTGKTIKPTPTVKYDGKKLKRGRDYTLSYKSNKNVGTAKVTITGKGNYKGTITKAFKIIPKKPTIKKPKAAKKAITVNWKAMKTKMSKKRITGYQVQIAKNNKFTKGKKSFKVKGYKETSYTFTKLKSKTKYFVRVRTYRTISGKTYYSKWSSVKNIKTK